VKCSVCAQEIPEEGYADHLETAHGVTDDPTAVLIQHLTGLRSQQPAEGDDVQQSAEEHEVGAGDDEPSDADAFEEFLAKYPSSDALTEARSARTASDRPTSAPPPTEPASEPPTAEDVRAEEEEPRAATAAADADADAGVPASDFDQMLAEHPAVDAVEAGQARRAGAEGWDAPPPPTKRRRRSRRKERAEGAADADALEAARVQEEARLRQAAAEREAALARFQAREAEEAAALAADVADTEPLAVTHAGQDEDEKSGDDFDKLLAAYPTLDAVEAARARRAAGETVGSQPAGAAGASPWDAPAPPGDDDTILVQRGGDGRRNRGVLMGLAAAIVLVAVAVVYLLTRDTGTSKTASPAPITTTATTVATTVSAGAQGGSPTTEAATSTTVATTPPAAPATTVAPPTTTAPVASSGGDPRSQMVFSYSGAECTPSGRLSVFGSVTNTSASTYTFSYTVTIPRADGSSQGTGSGSVAHLPPGARVGPGTMATGSCSYPFSAPGRPSQQITSITPG
jgi:hypothetical protein